MTSDHRGPEAPRPSLFDIARRHVEAEAAVVIATIVQSPSGPGARLVVLPDRSTQGNMPAELRERVIADGINLLRQGTSRTVSYESGGGETLVFYDVYPAPLRLLVFGGVHIAVPLVEFAKLLGFRVTVIDARGRFATADRFPKADQIVVEYADEFLARTKLDPSTYVVVLSHDPKLDDPALIGALRTDVPYVGAIGSRKTHAKRIERLRAAGLSDDQIDRIHAPVGLDIDARNPEEIALAIMAQIVAVKNGALSRLTRGSDRGSAQETGVPAPVG